MNLFSRFLPNDEIDLANQTQTVLAEIFVPYRDPIPVFWILNDMDQIKPISIKLALRRVARSWLLILMMVTVAAIIFSFQTSSWHQIFTLLLFGVTIFSSIFLGFFWYSKLIVIRTLERILTIFIPILTFLLTKLIPFVSPNKTWPELFGDFLTKQIYVSLGCFVVVGIIWFIGELAIERRRLTHFWESIHVSQLGSAN